MLHILSAGTNGADCVGEGEGIGDDVSGVFAEGVTGGKGGLNPSFGEDSCGGDGDGQDRGLGVLGELELIFGAVEDQLRERKTEGLVSLFEDRARGGEVVVEVASHANGLRALTGEEKGKFCHRKYRKSGQ